MPTYTNKQIADALRRTRGRKYLAAKVLECDPDTVRNRVKSVPYLAAIVENEKGLRGDIAETKLDDAVDAGDPWAIQFELKTQCRDRGYGDHQDVSVTGEIVKTIVMLPPKVDPG